MPLKSLFCFVPLHHKVQNDLSSLIPASCWLWCCLVFSLPTENEFEEEQIHLVLWCSGVLLWTEAAENTNVDTSCFISAQSVWCRQTSQQANSQSRLNRQINTRMAAAAAAAVKLQPVTDTHSAPSRCQCYIMTLWCNTLTLAACARQHKQTRKRWTNAATTPGNIWQTKHSLQSF